MTKRLKSWGESVISPTQLEFYLSKVEKKIIDVIDRHLGLLGVFSLAVLVGTYLIVHAEFFSPKQDFRMNGGYGIVRLIRFVVGWLVLVSPIALLVGDKWRKHVLFLITLVCWNLVTWYYFGSTENVGLIFVIYLSLPIQLIMSYAFLKKWPVGDRTKRAAIPYTIAFFALEIALGYAILIYGHEKKLFVFWNLKSQFIFFATIAAFFFAKNRKKFADVFLVPANCLIGFIWPTSTELCTNDRQEKKKLWLHGIYNILLGYAVIGIRMIYELYVLNRMELQIVRFSGLYILAIFGIIGHLNILAGVARLYGIKVIDPTRFIFLARSPAEYWRRGVVYHYLFIRNFIFLSLYRRIKLVSLCILLGFAFFLIKKVGLVNYVLFVNQFFGLGFIDTSFDHVHRELYSLIHWTIWFFLILISPYAFSRTQLFESKWKAWFSILCTHLLMAGSYYLTYVLHRYALDQKIFL